MSEYIVEWDGATDIHGWKYTAVREEIVRCRDCKHLDMPDWDNNLAACYGEPPLFCMQLSYNEWRMDGDRRVAEPTFLEVEPDGFCKWGEKRSNEAKGIKHESIVRCRDCEKWDFMHQDPDGTEWGECAGFSHSCGGHFTRMNGFCYWGEKVE